MFPVVRAGMEIHRLEPLIIICFLAHRVWDISFHPHRPLIYEAQQVQKRLTFCGLADLADFTRTRLPGKLSSRA